MQLFENCGTVGSRLRITFSAGHTAADVEALVKALSHWTKTKGPSLNFLPSPVYWFPASLTDSKTLKLLLGNNREVQSNKVRLRPKL